MKEYLQNFVTLSVFVHFLDMRVWYVFCYLAVGVQLLCTASVIKGVTRPLNEQMCGDGKCKCKGSYADCSMHGPNLTYIPRLPENITFLNFTYNRAAIDHDDFFLNVTGLDHLQLGNNYLRFISAGAFKLLKRLKILNLGNNNLTYVTLAPVMSISTLEKLTIINQGLGSLPQDFLKTSSVQIFQFYGNQVSSINMSEFSCQTELRLGSNKVSEFQTAYLPRLRILDLNNCGLQYFPQTCDGQSSLYPHLEKLYLRQNSIWSVPEHVCLPALMILDLSSNPISKLNSGMFSEHRFPSLQRLMLRNMHSHIEIIASHTFNNSKLLFLDLYGNSIDFGASSVSKDIFAGCTSLKNLTLTRNNFRNVDRDTFLQVFIATYNLINLNLGTCTIENLHKDSFSATPSLETLQLYENRLDDIPDGTFDELVNLTTLYLNRNELRTVRETMFTEPTRQRLISFDLSENPFQCNCDLMWFRQWYVSSNTLFSNRWKNSYDCRNLQNTTLANFDIVEQACFLNHETYVCIVVFLVILLVVIMAIVVLYRYRWHIRLMVYGVFRGREVKWHRLQADHFLYDVFVSHAEEDWDWVREYLMPELEERCRLRLCLQERDFHPGKSILDNTEECLSASKMTLVLFSSHYASGRWCQYELVLCHAHAIEQVDAQPLVVACLHDIPSRDQTPTMMAVMKTTTLIQWADDPDAIMAFWGRLNKAFKWIRRH